MGGHVARMEEMRKKWI